MKKAILLLIFFNFLYSANFIDISLKEQSILKKCDYTIELLSKNLAEIKKNFKPFNKEHLNKGVINKALWLHCKVKNSSNKEITKFLVFSSPLLEKITLYYQDKSYKKGVLSSTKHSNLLYSFKIKLKPKSISEFFIKVETIYSPIDFSLLLQDKDIFLKNDRESRDLSIFLLGIVSAFMIYALILGVYIKDKSYIFYSLYLFALIYHQISYLGVSALYFPKDFLALDTKVSIFKISLLIITSALFARSFLESKRFKKIDFIYKATIFISLIEIVLLNPTNELSLYIAIFTGAFFIIFNLFAGIYIYKKGKKEARLFVVGFSLVFISYFLIILDALGVISIIIYIRNILIITTAIEALILSLAFADRYIILQAQKEKADKRLLIEAQNREKIIQNEVEKKTKELNILLKEKELLMQEIHHRVKNNLQIILSMIRLQNDSIKDKNIKSSLIKLENRINAIAKAYSNLLAKETLQTINMKEYIKALIDDLVEIYDSKKITIKQNIKIALPFKKAVYIGLVVNELVTNAFKHAFKDKGEININLYSKDGENILEVIDNGVGFQNKNHSLGLKLIYSIIKHQLQGEIKIDFSNKTACIVRFR